MRAAGMNRILAELNKSHSRLILNNIRHTSTAKATVEGERYAQNETSSFVLSSFFGTLQTRHVFPFPSTTTNEEKEFFSEISQSLHKFYQNVNKPENNEKLGYIEESTLASMWDLGFFGLQAPAVYGGLELNNSQYAAVADIIGQYDLATAVFVGAHQSIGYKGILLFGTPEQKKKYLPRVTTGKNIAAFVLTEPASGSDAASIRSVEYSSSHRTRAELSSDGSHYILNGSKCWITNGGTAEIMTVFAKTIVKDPVNGKENDKLTAFIVERSFGAEVSLAEAFITNSIGMYTFIIFAGISSGLPEDKMGIRASNTTEVYFDNVKVPVENVLGEVGSGFKIAMNILNNGRVTAVSIMTGCQKTCISKAIQFAKQRKQFGLTIENYGSIQEKIGRMSTLQYISQSLAFMLAGNMDRGNKEYQMESAVSKVFSSEAAWWVCDEAIQIMGGMGYMRGPGLEKILRDLRIFRIFEGANDILRLFIALQGIQHVGSSFKERKKALQNPVTNLGVVLSETQKSAFRFVGLGQTPSLMHLVHPNLSHSAHLCAKSVELIGTSVEKLFTEHGKKITEDQFLLTRLGNCVIDAYTMAVVLSRATDSLQRDLPSASHEEAMTNYWCLEASDRIATSCRHLSSSQAFNSYKLLSDISRSVADNGGVLIRSPPKSL